MSCRFREALSAAGACSVYNMFCYQPTVSEQPLNIPYCQVNQVLIACGVNSWYKKVMVVVEVLNLCVLDYVIPMLPLPPCLEVEDKFEYQSLNQSLSGSQERIFLNLYGRKCVKLAIERLW